MANSKADWSTAQKEKTKLPFTLVCTFANIIASTPMPSTP